MGGKRAVEKFFGGKLRSVVTVLFNLNTTAAGGQH